MSEYSCGDDENDNLYVGNSNELNNVQSNEDQLPQSMNHNEPLLPYTELFQQEPSFNPVQIMKTIMEGKSFTHSQYNDNQWGASSNGQQLQEVSDPLGSWTSPTVDLDMRRKKIENTMKLIQNMIATDNDSRKNKTFQQSESNYIYIDTSNTVNQIINGKDNHIKANVAAENHDNTKAKVVGHSKKFNTQHLRGKVEVKIEIKEEASMDFFLKDMAGVVKECVDVNKVISSDISYEQALQHFQDGCTDTDIYYECCFCDLLFANVKRFLIHYKWHTSSMSQAKQLSFIKFKTEKKQTKPPIQDANDKGAFPCHLCHKPFKLMSRLQCHKNKCHPETVEVSCEMCHTVFGSAEELKSHIPNHDVLDGSGMFRCTTEGCDKLFKHKHSLTRHAYTHMEPTHMCQHCSKKFCSPALLAAHVKRHTRTAEERKHACTFCDKSFFDKFTLTAHLRCHNNDRPFKCTNCSASYVTNSSLKRHIKISHGEKNPYSCNDCGRTFPCEVMLSKHEAKMHGDPEIYTYQCRVCPYRFMTPQELRKHMYKTHKIKARS